MRNGTFLVFLTIFYSVSHKSPDFKYYIKGVWNMGYKLTRELIMAYDELFIGLSDRLPIKFFSNISSAICHATALELFRYALDTRLHWSPTEIRDYLTMEVIDDLKLRPVFRYINFPNGLIKESSLFYIAWAIYPQTQNKSIADMELVTYRKYLDGAIKKLPQHYFKDEFRTQRAYNCLIDRLNYYHPFSSDDPFYMYEYFVSPGCVPFLGKSKLIKICVELNINPLEFFFSALSNNQRDFIMFSFFEFMLQYNSVKEISPKLSSVTDDDEPIIIDEDDAIISEEE